MDLCGYPKDMEKLFQHNDGLPSRFPIRLVFEDYNADELGEIFKSLCVLEDPQSPKGKFVAPGSQWCSLANLGCPLGCVLLWAPTVNC